MNASSNRSIFHKLLRRWPWFVTGLSLIVVILLLVFAAWTRRTLLPAVSQGYYWRVAHVYDREFEPFNAELHKLGFQFIDAETLPPERQGGLETWQPLHGCKTMAYQNIHVDVVCQKVREYRPASLPDFKTQWAKKHAAIVTFLEQNNWQKGYTDQPDLSQLLTGPQDTGQWLTYVENKGENCHLTIAYNPPYQNPDDQMWIHEDCARDVK